MRSLIGLIVALLIVFVGYRLYFSQLQSSTGSVAPARTIEVVGVKNDLLSIAQSERIYQAQHGSYGTLDELTSSGALSIPKTGRDGYTYEVETSAGSFQVIARCPTVASAGCTNYSVDDTMEVHTMP